MNKEQVENFLAEEQKKIDKADELLKELKSIWFGLFNPRYWRTARELNSVIKSFRLGQYKINH